jgi:hypothetical protein
MIKNVRVMCGVGGKDIGFGAAGSVVFLDWHSI